MCAEIDPECEDKYIYGDLCIVGPNFHYQKIKAEIYQERRNAKRANFAPKVISIQKPVKSRSKEKTLPQLLDLAQKVFNEYIRKRDCLGDYFVCISCNTRKGLDQMNAGHYYSAGNHSFLRFNEYNVHGQCIKCNCHMHGHLIAYREGLNKKIGNDQLSKLDLYKNVSQKWDKVQLKALIQIYRDKIKKGQFNSLVTN